MFLNRYDWPLTVFEGMPLTDSLIILSPRQRQEGFTGRDEHRQLVQVSAFLHHRVPAFPAHAGSADPERAAPGHTTAVDRYVSSSQSEPSSLMFFLCFSVLFLSFLATLQNSQTQLVQTEIKVCFNWGVLTQVYMYSIYRIASSQYTSFV